MLIFAGVGTFDFANASAMIFSICDFFTARSVKFASAAASAPSKKTPNEVLLAPTSTCTFSTPPAAAARPLLRAAARSPTVCAALLLYLVRRTKSLRVRAALEWVADL